MVVRGLKIDPPLFLAPMAGLTHTALRRLVARLGGCGSFSTEMLSARSLRAESPDTSPWLMRTESEKPLFWQVLVTTVDEVEASVAKVAGFGADGVDLNYGCPAPDIRKRGGGSKLMERPELAGEIACAARRSAGELPLSAKIRLGETGDEGYLRDFCQMLAASGVDMITVHARFRRDSYGRKPKWEWIGKIKGWVDVPVIGNGSICTPAQARSCLDLTGCDGLMVGREAAKRPWVFNELAREVYGMEIPVARPVLPEVWREFCVNVEESFQPEKRLGRLKEFTHYFAQNYAFGHTLASAVQGAKAMEDAKIRAEAFFAKTEER